MSAKTTIEDKLQTMLADSSNFNSLNAIVIGLIDDMPEEYFPYVEIFIPNEFTVTEYTGAWHERVYEGQLWFWVHGQDGSVTDLITSRKVTVPSYRTVDTLVDAAIELFKDKDNRTLNDLTFTNGNVVQIHIGDQPATYGIERSERTNNWLNYGAVGFRVVTLEQHT